MAGLSGCIVAPESAGPGSGPDPDPERDLALAASISNPGAASKACPKPPSRSCEDGFLPSEADACLRRLVAEPWNGFDASLWHGDGDQAVSDGKFTAREGAESATADWLAGAEGALSENRTFRFSNQLAMDEGMAFDSSLREGLFFLSGDADGSFSNYLFVSIRYSRAQRSVLLESFGASDGVEFDRVAEAPWNPAPRASLSLQMEAAPGCYRVLLDGMLADSIPLARPLACVTVAEVGVQSGESGRFGLIDSTAIDMVMPLATAPLPGHRGRPWLRHCHRHAGDAIHREDWKRKRGALPHS